MATTTRPRIKKAPQSKSIWPHLRSRLVCGWNMLRTWQHQYQVRHDLQRLNGWLLEDVGLRRRVNVDWRVTTTFWQP
jgi:uncharacterized protein YjiS (DUF1127 family)